MTRNRIIVKVLNRIGYIIVVTLFTLIVVNVFISLVERNVLYNIEVTNSDVDGEFYVTYKNQIHVYEQCKSDSIRR